MEISKTNTLILNQAPTNGYLAQCQGQENPISWFPKNSQREHSSLNEGQEHKTYYEFSRQMIKQRETTNKNKKNKKNKKFASSQILFLNNFQITKQDD